MTELNPQEAFLKAQTEFGHLEKNKINPFYKSKYADLADVMKAVEGPLNKNGLSVTQPTALIAGAFGIITKITHVKTKETVAEGFYIVQPSKANDPQQLSAAVTYARRAALCSLLAIVADDDTDGNDTVTQPQASERPVNRSETAQEPAKAPQTGRFKTISEKQANRLYAIWKSAGWDDKEAQEKMFTEWGYKSTKDVAPEYYEEICAAFGKKPAVIENLPF